MSDFELPSLSAQISQTQADINGRIPGADSRVRRSVLGALGRVFNGLVNGLYGQAERQAGQLFVDTTDDVARQGAIFGIPQKAATYARGDVVLTGTDGAGPVPVNSLLQRADGAQYRTLFEVSIDGTSATVTVSAVVAGIIANAVADTSLSFVSPVAGVLSTCTVDDGGITGGTDMEDTEAWRGRILSRLRNPPQGGARSDYERWAKEVPGVTRAWVYPRMMGGGTVGLAFVYDGRESIFPTGPERTAMKAYIEARCPVHLTENNAITIVTLAAQPVNFIILSTPDTSIVRDAIAAQLADLFRRVAEPAGSVPLSQINEAISLAAGESDHDLVSPSTPPTAAPGFMLTLGDIAWEE